MRKAELASLGIDVEKFNAYLVALVDTRFFYGVVAFPVELAYMQQALLARHEFHKATVGHDAYHLGFVGFAHFGNCHNGAYLCHSSVDAFLVGSRNLHFSNAIGLVDCNGSAGFFLHALYNLSARAYYGSDVFLGDIECHDTRNLRLEVGTRRIYYLKHFVEYVLACILCLHEGLLENFV